MGVTIIGPGVVRVDYGPLDADDILEFAAALIEEHGWFTGGSGDEETGWSIHGAIGEAARLATESAGKDEQKARELRDAAAEKLRDLYRSSSGMTPNQAEFDINDTAGSEAVVIRLLNEARGEQHDDATV